MECCLQSAWMQEIQRQIALRHSPLPTNHALAWLTPSYYHSSIIYPSSSHSSFTNHNFSPLLPISSFFFWARLLYMVLLLISVPAAHVPIFRSYWGFAPCCLLLLILWTWTQKVQVFWPTLPSASHRSKNIPNCSVVLITHTMPLPIPEQCALHWDILLSVLHFFFKSLSLGAFLLLYTFLVFCTTSL